MFLFYRDTEEAKGKKDAERAKEVRGQKEEIPKGNGKSTERPRFMFNIADGGFTGSYHFII